MTQDGDFLSPGASQLLDRVRPLGSNQQSVATVDDGVWEPDGSVTLEVLPGDGYQVSPTAGSATVKILDDDDYADVSASSLSLGAKLGDGVRATVRSNGDAKIHTEYGKTGGPCWVGVWNGARCVTSRAETAYELSLAADPEAQVTVWVNTDSHSIGICHDDNPCAAMRRARDGANHHSIRLFFDTHNWDMPRTIRVFRFPESGAGTATISHTAQGVFAPVRGPIGGNVTVTLTGASQYAVEVPAPTPKTCPGKTNNGVPITVPAGQDCPQQPDTVTDYSGDPDSRSTGPAGTTTVERPEPVCEPRPDIVSTVRGYHQANRNRAGYAGNWARVLTAFAEFGEEYRPVAPWHNATPFTVADAQAQEQHWKGWTPVRIELTRLHNCP